MADDMIHVTVAQDGETLAQMTFVDRNMSFKVGGVALVCRDAMVESAGAPIWQRVAHAAMVAAYTEQGLGDVEDET